MVRSCDAHALQSLFFLVEGVAQAVGRHQQWLDFDAPVNKNRPRLASPYLFRGLLLLHISPRFVLGTRPYRFSHRAVVVNVVKGWGKKKKKMKGVDGWHCLLCLWGRALAKLLRGSTSWHRRLPRCGCQRPQALDSVSVCLILFVRRETAVGSTADVRVHPPQWRLSAIFFQRVLFFFCCLRCQKSDDGWLWHLVLSLESLKWWDGHFNT